MHGEHAIVPAGGPGSHVDANTGPKVTVAAIEENISTEMYFTTDVVALDIETGCRGNMLMAKDGGDFESLELMTVCVMVLANGFTIVGTSACADPSNFDAEIGRKIARQNCINQIWPLMGYELKSRLDRLELIISGDKEPLDEALTRLAALRLGNDEAFRATDAEEILSHFESNKTPNDGANS